MKKTIKLSIASVLLLIMCFVIVNFTPLFFRTRTLTDVEREIIQSIFLDNIDLEKIRIKDGGPLTLIYPALTIGNTISFSKKSHNLEAEKESALLLHEITHVWQFQHFGWSYLPQALFEEITQKDAYVVHFDEQKTFRKYDIEEQAEIVAEYFLTQEQTYIQYINEIQIIH